MAAYQPITLPGPLRLKPKGLFGQVLDVLDRPRLALAESIGAIGASEDPFEAMWAALAKGRQRYPSIGEKLFPGAAEPGFQPEDIGVFAANVLTDPLTWVGPGLLKAGMKPIAKGILAGTAKLMPKAIKPLAAVDWASLMKAPGLAGRIGEATPTALRRLLPKLPKPEAKVARAALKGVKTEAEIAAARQDILNIVQAVPEWEKFTSDWAVLEQIRRDHTALGLNVSRVTRRMMHQFPERFAMFHEAAGGPMPAWFQANTVKELKGAPRWYLDFYLGSMRDLESNFRPVAKTALQSIAQEFGLRVFPSLSAAARFGGPAGKTIADKYKAALFRATRKTRVAEDELAGVYRGMRKVGDRELSALVREAKATTADTRIVQASDLMGQQLDRFGDEVAGFRDAYGQGMKVYDATLPKRQRWVDFSERRIKNYFPRMYDQKTFTSAGKEGMKRELMGRGMSEMDAEKFIKNRLAVKPRRVGHMEMARLGDEAGYELDPLKVLPKLYRDGYLRMELAREFGVNNELLDTLLSDTMRAGISKDWLLRFKDVLIGIDPYDRWMNSLSSAFTSFQSISKLGVATTVSNVFQAPINQISRSGPINFAKALIRGGAITPGGIEISVPSKFKRLGAMAYSRSFQEDMMKYGLGEASWLDKFMGWIGFKWSERMGRHLGAVGGYVEADDLAKQWLRVKPTAKAKVAGELKRKYGFDVEKQVVKVGDDQMSLGNYLKRNGTLPDDLRELAGLRAADATMHAFSGADLPIGWRDPTWRMILQFKTFIYKQTQFYGQEVVAPALHWFASDGKAGNVWPLIRTAAVVPVGAELVAHTRDMAKSIPPRIYMAATGQRYKWDYKDPFWEDPDPGMRFWNDLMYVGTLGILGDIVQSAQKGRLLEWLAGPTISQAAQLTQAPFKGTMGKELTRLMPGAAAIPYGTDIVEQAEALMKKLKR